MRNTHRVLASAIVCVVAVAAASAAHVASDDIDLRAYEQTRDRDDAELGIHSPASTACVTGSKSKRFDSPAAACGIAYENALVARRFDEALSYAIAGCRTHHRAVDCRRAARLPLVMGNDSIRVPVEYAAEIRRLGEFVCLSGVRLKQAYGPDSTGRECTHFARQFNMADDDEYRFAVKHAAREYFQKTQDAAFAIRLLNAACERLGYRPACDAAKESIVSRQRMEHTSATRRQQGTAFTR